MSEPVELVLSEREEGIRLDKVLAERLPDLTRTAIQRLLEEEQVLINGKPAAKNRKGRAGDSVAVRIPDPEPLCLQAENVPLDIVYEDDDLLVVNKPQGMVVHPAPGNYQGTLVNALLAHCGNSLSGINGVIRPGIVPVSYTHLDVYKRQVFKEIVPLSTYSTFVLCDPNPEEDATFNGETIKLYDEVVVGGTDLYDGKIV